MTELIEDDWPQRLAELTAAEQSVRDDAREGAFVKQRAAGKLTARERIALLADPGTFRESGNLVSPSRETQRYTGDRPVPADGMIVGACLVDGRQVAVAAIDFSVLGGSIGTIGTQKFGRQIERARSSGTPLVMLLEGGGHRIQEGLDSRHFAGGYPLFRLFPGLSGWIPVVTAVLGPGFAGPSNFAAMSDFVVTRRGISQLGIAGPALVKAATGEDRDAESLGGAIVHADKSGIADLALDSDEAAIRAIRDYLSFLPSNAQHQPPMLETVTEPEPADLTEIVPLNLRRPYDVRHVIRAVVDDGSVFELKPTYARNIVTAFARIGGRAVGIIANQPMHMAGALDTPACEKGAHFVSVCDAFGLPLVYLIDVPGFLVGSPAETSGLARRSGRLVFELGNATVPRFSVAMRKGYGLAYIAMCGGRSFDADLAVAWPSAELCAMSVEGAVDVLFAAEIAAHEDPEARRAELIREHRSELGALYGASGYGIDAVIEPNRTREVLLDAIARAPSRHLPHQVPRYHSISPV